MKLNIRAQTAQNQHNNSPIVLVHGLFGSLDNLGVLARDLVNDHDIPSRLICVTTVFSQRSGDELPGDGPGSC